jgi:hypothetical protein
MQSISFGNYQLSERIFTGKKTEIFRATRLDVSDIERLVAVKRLLPALAADEQAVSDFNEEARIAVQLTHGAVAQVLDAGTTDGIPYMALEYVDGKDLRAIIERMRESKTLLAVPFSCYVLIKLCEGLTYIHEKKNPSGAPLELVHQDISMGNILVSYDGEIKIVDFGSTIHAKKKREGSPDELPGTYGYMSPEQVQNKEIDRRSDIFCAGICLYELLTNHRLFSDRSDFAALQQVRDVDILPPSNANRQVTEELEQIVIKALARNPGDRFQTAQELHDALQGFMYKSGFLYGRKEIAAAMGEFFGSELEDEYSVGSRASPAAQPAADEEGTGLFAFEDLEPVSVVSEFVQVETFRQQAAAAPAARPQQPPAAALQGYQRPQGASPAAVRAQQAAPRPEPPAVRYKATLLGIPSTRGPSSRPPPIPRSAPPPGPADTAPYGKVPTPKPVPGPPASRPSQPAPHTPVTASRPPTPQAASPLAGYTPPPGDFDDEKTGLWIPQSARGEEEAASRADASAPMAPIIDTEATPTPGRALPFRPITDERLDTDADALAFRTSVAERWRSTSVPIAVAAVVAAVALAVLFSLRGPSTGTVALTTTPEDTVVKLDGEPISDNSSPFEIGQVAANTSHIIEVSKAGFISWSTTVKVNAGQKLDLPPVILDPLRVETGFAVDSDPGGASVFVDGKGLGQKTPVRVTDLKPGPHEIRIEKDDGYETWMTRLEVPPNQIIDLQTVTLLAKPEPEPEREPVEEAEPEREKQEIKRVVRRPTRRRTARRSSRASASRRRAARRTPAAATSGGTGVLRVNTRPWSQVYVGNRLVGNTPQMGIQLPSGRHRITLVNPAFGIRKTISVRIRAGQTVTKILTLIPGG